MTTVAVVVTAGIVRPAAPALASLAAPAALPAHLSPGLPDRVAVVRVLPALAARNKVATAARIVVRIPSVKLPCRLRSPMCK